MPDQPDHIIIRATAHYATWPGERAVCCVLSSPKYFDDQWYLGHTETGQISELVPYRYGMLGRRPSRG